MEADLPYWLAINQRSSAFSASTIALAIARFGSLQNLWNANTDMLLKIGFNETTVSNLVKLKRDFSIKDFEKLSNELKSEHVNVIRFIDKEYPRQLKEIRTVVGPPLMIFVKGKYRKFSDCVAIVGTRNCSFYGRTTARHIARRLADKGYTIVSGLARGVDEEAHCGALESRYGRTFAILPWFDPIYPDEHSELAADIEKRGARISENYTKSFGKLTSSKFVERNRITSAISNFVIAIETDADGGTIRQLELANLQNKPVFVLIPKDNERAQRGFNHIIENLNGIPFSNAEELFEHIQSNNLEPSAKLSEYNLNSQLTLD
ncbi:DNA-processing protein DprA [Nitrososphaera sp.]|uniref:DNA-processing protein DprA n=1 Tax=Nitrososphaera sp. TaxID=1971748 RepID=UPI00317F4FA3